MAVRRLLAFLASAVLVAVPACSDDGGPPEEGVGAPIAPAPTVVADPGLVVVDPTSGTSSTIEVANIPFGQWCGRRTRSGVLRQW